MNQAQLDPVSVLITLAALFFSPQVAAIVGPYAVIWVGSTLGAYYALGTREVTSRSQGVKFFLVANAWALLLTVPAAYFLKPYISATLDERWIFGPAALLIGLFWERLPKWALSFVRSKIGRGEGDKS